MGNAFLHGGCRGFQKVTEEGQRGKQKVYSFTQIRHVYVMINVQAMEGTLTHCVNQEGAPLVLFSVIFKLQRT